MAFNASWDAVPVYLTLVLTIGLAFVLLYLDFQKRANRAFALLLLLRGASLLVGSFRNAATTGADFEFFQRLLPYFQLPQVPALLYFVLVYPRPRTWIGRSRFGGWSLLAAALALEALYAISHSLYWSFEPGTASNAILNAGGGFRYTSFGPLVALSSFSVPMTCLAAVLLARDYLAERPGKVRFSLVLIIAGLVLSGLYFGTQYVVGLARLLADSGSGFPWLPWGWAFAAVPALALPLAATALAIIWAGSRRTLNRDDDREANRLLAIAPIPLVWSLIVSLGANDVFGDELSVFSLGIWRLLMPLLVTYALLRYRLFDLDVKARLTIHYGGVAAAFGLVFFVAGEMAEGLVAQRFLPAQMGQWAGLLAAGLLTLAIKPLEKASRRVAHKILPSAKAIHELNEAERHALYRDQFAMALQDGRLTESERKMLVQLQAKLGIQPKKSSVPRAANMKPRGVSGVKSKV